MPWHRYATNCIQYTHTLDYTPRSLQQVCSQCLPSGYGFFAKRAVGALVGGYDRGDARPAEGVVAMRGIRVTQKVETYSALEGLFHSP